MRRWEDVKMRGCEDVMWRWEDVKMRRCEDVKMWRCEDVRMYEKMWRCEDVKMWGCDEDVMRMWRWEDEKMWRQEDEKMWRCEDVRMRRCENVWQALTIRRTIRSDALGKFKNWKKIIQNKKQTWQIEQNLETNTPPKNYTIATPPINSTDLELFWKTWPNSGSTH